MEHRWEFIAQLQLPWIAMQRSAAETWSRALEKPASTVRTWQRFHLSPALIGAMAVRGWGASALGGLWECVLGCSFTWNEPSGCHVKPRLRNGVYQENSFKSVRLV